MMKKEEHIKESIKIYVNSGYSISESKKMALRDWNNYKQSIKNKSDKRILGKRNL